MKILLIDDDTSLCRSLTHGLNESGYLVESAYDAESGENDALFSTYDLIILDIMLPDKSGIDVCHSLREQGLMTPVLMLTARNSIEEKISGLDAGADDYLTKPFNFPELLARIRALLRRLAPITPQTIVLNDVTLNTTTRVVTKNGNVVHFTPTEYRILEYLMTNPGTLITRTMIEEYIWGLERSHESNVIDAHINKVRAKLEIDPISGFIQTVRGDGYRFVPC